jgi:hypothetical protein
MLFREMPRFELATLPEEIIIGRWKILGDRVVPLPGQGQSTREHWLSVEAGAASLRFGSVPMERAYRCRLETLVNSYADAYRVQIHRISAASDAVFNVGRLLRDSDLLRNWNVASTAEFAEKRV